MSDNGYFLADADGFQLIRETFRKFLRQPVERHFNPFVPHLRVKDVTEIDWSEFKRKAKCVRYVVFDKDNTLTRPKELKYFSKGENDTKAVHSGSGD